MARKHTFFIVVLLAAAALAGLVAVGRTVALAKPQPAAAPSTTSQDALQARLRALDRFEAKLRKQLRASPAKRAAVPTAVVTRAAPAPAPAYDDDEHEDEHEEDDD